MDGTDPALRVANPADARPLPLRLLTFTTLYPNRSFPNHGIFVENRLRQLLATHPVTARVLAPVPWFPLASPRFGTWARHARVARQETRHGLAIDHPRYLAIPRLGMSAAPFLLYRAAAGALARMLGQGFACDLIDAHYLYPDGVAAVWLGRRFGLPVVITARGSDVTQLPGHAVPRRLIQGAIAGADALISVSAALKEGLVALGAPAEKVTVLRNGVDTALFHPGGREAARQALGLTRPTLLSVGHLIVRKGHHLVITALASLPDTDLLIAGEGPERARLEADIARLGLAGRVRLLGARPHGELQSLYAAADALVLASSREGWANVLLEAMACGTPVVASRIPGNPEVVQRREAGLLVEENTAAGIARAVRTLFAAPPARAATRAYAEAFGWEPTSAGQYALFRGLLRRA
ncbi:MAG: glycosyltransferase family 4 protein [Acetobacteraceae bacterium]